MKIWLLILAVGAIFLLGYLSRRSKLKRLAERRSMLLSKYGDEDIVADIINGLIRQGMTYEMVLEAWGRPTAVDRKVYKTKTKEILKYGPGPRRSFANRVTIEDGIVVGWEQR